MLLQDLIFCEDIRFEAKGSITLVGVVEDRLRITVPADVPAPTIRSAVYVRLGLEPSDDHVRHFKLSLLYNGEHLISSEGQFPPRLAEQRLRRIYLFAPQLKLSAPGKMTFQIELFDAARCVQVIQPEYAVEVLIERLETQLR
jgi:hypothetical protein